MPDQPPTPPPPPPEVPSERRARPAVLWGALAAAAAVVVALVVVGVTVDDGDGGQQTVAPAGLELDQLEPALLTGDEVADGYREIRTSSDDSGALEDAFETDSEGCRELLDLMDGGRDDEPELEVAFARPDGRSVEQSMALVDE